jgi:soluble lytic murein transglycosylase-like protein
MVPWLLGIGLCLALLAGCSGANQGNLVQNEAMLPPELDAAAPVAGPEESLTEELSAKRLEELYAKSGIPGWDPGLEQELKQWDHQVKFDVPIQMNKQVRAYLVYFSTERKEVIRRYLSRSSRYLPLIKEVFQECGLPEDLAYLAMIESGFNPNAYSHAAACGMWQFIRGTGARYGLMMDGYVDERRDPEKSTRAAAKYLQDLYKQFGSWYLAAASYNCGEGRVQRELNQSKHKNFWELSANQCLPTETKNYVPQMIAATIIAKNPEKFGFKGVPYQPPLAVEKVTVNEPTSLKAAAVAVNVPAEEMQLLNPELLRGVTPPDQPAYGLNLPGRSKELFARNIVFARVEHPAVATRAVRTAKSPSRSQARETSTRQSTASKSEKTKVAAKSGKKQTMTVAQAKKAKSGSGNASPHVASVFGGPAGSGKSGKNGAQTASAGAKAKGKEQAHNGSGKKQGSASVAKKSDNGAKSAKSDTAAKGAKNGKNAKTATKNGRTKDKISQAKSSHLVVSEVR